MAKIPLTFQIYKGSQLVRTEKLIVSDPIRIGKVTNAQLKLEEEGVSRMHAEISLASSDTIHISDLGSQKGTFVNGQKVGQKHNLRSGDEIKIGEVRMILTIGQPIIEQVPQASAASAAPVRVAPRYVMPPIDLSLASSRTPYLLKCSLFSRARPYRS
jgi:pSer/pThr/pTyr-binding forkhead associated (FHA) protein